MYGNPSRPTASPTMLSPNTLQCLPYRHNKPRSNVLVCISSISNLSHNPLFDRHHPTTLISPAYHQHKPQMFRDRTTLSPRRTTLAARISSMLFYVVLQMFLVSTISHGKEAPDANLSKHHQINLIQELNLHNFSYSGLSVDRKNSIESTIYLHEDISRTVKLNSQVCKRATNLISRSNEVTFIASLKQITQNTGVIFSFADGIHRVLEIQSSGRRKELRFHYRLQETVFTESFNVDLADDTWHKIALTISDIQLDLYIDCVHRFQRRIQPIDRESLIKRNLTLWLGQRGLHHFMYQGYLKDVRIITSANGYRAQCPDLDLACPTCGQFKSLKDSISQLENTVKYLTEKLRTMEQRLTNVESCECVKSCRVNGTVHADGSTWKQDCQRCSCSAGVVTCTKIKCENSCRNPNQVDPCCPKCKKQCLFKSKILNDGEKFTYMGPSKCVQCVCKNGLINCSPFQMDKCPKLNCSANKWIQPHGQCCMICEGTDFCSQGHKCHPNAECRNLRANYTCLCNAGFRGNGHTCEDVDECTEKRHKCVNSECVNKLGSYECRCKSGFTPIDAYNCIDIDECSTNQHMCHENAICTNLPGSHQCKCKEGYEGDGRTCKPVCKHSCLNGGQCVAPNTCSCRKGYYGHRCEADIDECSLGLHQCPPNSKCINKRGWYRCQCNDGFEPKRDLADSNIFELECQDVNECLSPLLNTCPSTSKCVNLNGSYRCDCVSSGSDNGTSDDNSIKTCSDLCIFNGVERRNKEKWPKSSKEQCTYCQCLDGVVTCKPIQCNCNDDDIDLHCCPECKSNGKMCRHQENKNIFYKNGQQWNYDCQTCECMNGEIDCWSECPPTNCLNPIRVTEDCCLRCEDDPCQSSPHKSNFNSTLAGCRHLDRQYQSGQMVHLEQDNCATCLCQNGRLCCSYTFPCVSESELEITPVDAARASSKYSANHSKLENNLPLSDIGHYIKRFLTENVDEDDDEENDDKSIDEEDEDNFDADINSSHEHHQPDDKKLLPSNKLYESVHNRHHEEDSNRESDDGDGDWSHELATNQ